MDTFLISFETVLPLFLVIFAGLLFSRTKVSSENWVEILNKYALWIGFPALVIFSLMQLDLDGKSYTSLILLNTIFIFASMFLAFPVSKFFGLSVNMKRSLFLILPFGNVSYLGIPILYSAFGNEVLPIAAIISAVYVFWLLTLAILLIEIYGEDKINLKKLFLSLVQNPLLLSVFIGLAIVAFKIQVPGFVEKTIQLFAESVTAVVLFSLGIFLGMQKTGKLKEWIQVAILSVVTMFILPLVFYMIVLFLPYEINNLKAIIIDAAMPLGVTPYVLAIQYKLKTTLVARVVVFGTILSMFIIPLWMVILG
ncbi:MAG: AEC family transporter [Prolixibacteraceae bacterium]|jgi:predicted permease|nr:AEC family transporter [Prolixibacteraceae bacterium]MBT6005186.1 AEC family transporter [Prolixibacteraceae bacterium]MBT7000874.1 AEC family transporter [Prolixibacteraceae bacterium]MBT7394752.1 AEC family transporter [Prolixibacteraceae bacterium]